MRWLISSEAAAIPRTPPSVITLSPAPHAGTALTAAPQSRRNAPTMPTASSGALGSAAMSARTLGSALVHGPPTAGVRPGCAAAFAPHAA